jgi:hypothetical protein
MFLHDPKILCPTKQLDRAGMPQGVRVQGRDAGPRGDGLDELPEPLSADSSFDLLATLSLVRDHEERRRGGRARSLGGEIFAKYGPSRRRQDDRHLVTALGFDPTLPELGGDVADIERRHLATAEHHGER